MDIQEYIFNKAQKFTIENTRVANSYDEFKSLIKNEGGFVSAHWGRILRNRRKN